MRELFLAKSLKFYFIKIIDKELVKYIDDDYWTWKNHILDIKNQFDVNDVDKVYRTFLDLYKVIMRLLSANALNIKNVKRIKLDLNNIFLFDYLKCRD